MTKRLIKLLKISSSKKRFTGYFVSTAFGNIGVGKALKKKEKDLVVVGNDLGEGWIPYIKEGIIDCCLFRLLICKDI